MDDLRSFAGPNAGYVLELYERYARDPSSVDAATREFFASWVPPDAEEREDGAATASGAAAPAAVARPAAEVLSLEDAMPSPIGPHDAVRLAMGATALAQAIREYGHLAARVDPLGSEPPGDPNLEPSAHHILEEELTTLGPGVVRSPAAPEARTALDVIRRLREVYSGASGYDFTHVQSAEERAWLGDAVESGRFGAVLTATQKRSLLKRLTEIELFERYLQERYPGKTRFSIEGVDVLVPMLDEILRSAAEAGTREVVMGMAHRGRLNVLAHVLGRPYAAVLAEFRATKQGEGAPFSVHHLSGWTGDVKYHAGARRVYSGNTVVDMSVTLAPNPSHLEFVNPVVEGRARSAQEQRDQPGQPGQDDLRSLPILMHGDAAFPGQGIVAETLNLSRLPGYRTGGTVHIIVNNQIGFTTEPRSGRSTLYASDLAKGFEIPIVHVNADDPEACLAAARLAHAYRLRFRKDMLIDLIGYRRLGHNEGDEPAFTQPGMYAAIAKHPTIRQLWATRLTAEGVISNEEERSLLARARAILESAGAETGPTDETVEETPVETEPAQTPTAVLARDLIALNDALARLPEGFRVHRGIARILERRARALRSDAAIDWGHAELLAMASIVADGTAIRLTGQDTQRGTFSQRHAVLHEVNTGAVYVPLQSIPQARASFAVYDSPLSESAVLGFEYGYSIQTPGVLTLWEAQYGDFINSAQVMIDEFVASGYAKWGQTPSLVLLLPHGYEGQGPDHSSARIERFLRLCANNNIRVANCSTAAQYFHLLRRQAALLGRAPRPLVIFTPKSLLRHPRASSRLANLAEGAFQPVIDSAEARGRADEVTRVLLCSGKVFVDLEEHRERADQPAVAIVRVEQLYPVPEDDLSRVLEGYYNRREVLWVQEEPKNMGAWPYLNPWIRAVVGNSASVGYVGRPERGSPAEGSPEVHADEQARLVEEAYSNVPVLRRQRNEVVHAR